MSHANLALPRLQIDSEVTRCIRQHARAHMKTEVCGVLIGQTLDGTIEVRAMIEALHAAQAGTHVTFTQDAWEAIYKVKDQSYPEERIVGWYHSHPGFGVFLSDHDTFIHRNFFSSPDQVAWVYDPHTDEEGCFGWADGEIHRLPNFSFADTSDGEARASRTEEGFDGAEEPDLEPDPFQIRRGKQRKQIHIGVLALTAVATMVFGFCVAFFLFPRPIPMLFDPASGGLVEIPPDLLRAFEQHQEMLSHGVVSSQPSPKSQPPAAAPDPTPGRSK